MKKTLALFMVGLFVFSGCSNNSDSNSQPVAEAPQEMAEKMPEATKEEPVALPPSQSDGDIYIEALTKKDKSLCAKITDGELRKKCQE